MKPCHTTGIYSRKFILNNEKPFASLPNYVGKECKRVLINRERVGKFKFNDPTNKTDVFYKVSFEPWAIHLSVRGVEEAYRIFRVMRMMDV